MPNSDINDPASLRRKLSAIEEIIDAQERSYYDLHRELSVLRQSLPRKLTSAEVKLLFGRLTTFHHLRLPILSTLKDDILRTEDRLGDEWQTALASSSTRLAELEIAARTLVERYTFSEKWPRYFSVLEILAELIKWLGNFFEIRTTPCRELQTELNRRLDPRGMPAEQNAGKRSATRGRPSTADRDMEIFRRLTSGEATREQIAEYYGLKPSTMSHAIRRGKQLSSEEISTRKRTEAPSGGAELVEVCGRVLLPDGTPSHRALVYVLRRRREAVSKDGRSTVKIVHPDVFRIVKRFGFKVDDLLREASKGDAEALIAILEGGAGVDSSGERSPPPVARTDQTGSFQFTALSSWLQPTSFDGLQVLAIVPGLGPAWTTVTTIGECNSISLRLVDDVPISGRIVGEDGMPVSNAIVRMGTILEHGSSAISTWRDAIGAYATGDVSRFDELRNREFKSFPGTRLPGIHRITKTDDDGRFKVAGVGAERVVLGIEVYGEGFVKDQFSVVTGTQPKHPLPTGSNALWPSLRTYNADFEHKVTSSGRVVGTVLGRAGTTVAALGPTDIISLADSTGRYELVGLPISKSITVTARPPIPNRFPVSPLMRGSPGIARLVDVGDGDHTASVDFDLINGVVVHGEVRDKTTGLPIGGAKVCYAALKGNPQLEARFTYEGQRQRSDGSTDRERYQLLETCVTTETDGTYRIVGLPGSGYLAVSVPSNAFSFVSNHDRLRKLAKYSVPDLSARSWNLVRKIDLPDVGSLTVDLWLLRS